MALHLARRKQRLPSNPSLIKLFSTSSSDPPPQNDNAAGENPSQSSTSSSSSSPSQFSFSSYFNDIKASLRQRPQQQQQQQNARKPFSRFDTKTQNLAGPASSIEEIRRNLSEFRRLSSVPPPGDPGVAPPSQSRPQISFQDLYKRNVISNSGDSSADSGHLKGGNPNFDIIRKSLEQIRSKANATNSAERKAPGSMPLSRFQNSLKMKPSENVSSNVIGGTEALPISVFGKEMEERKAEKGNEDETEEMKTEFLKTYSADELGEKLRLLRPEGKKEEGWFTLQELNERLIKLREMEVEEAKSRKGGLSFTDLRAGIQKLRISDEEQKKKTTLQRLDILGQLGGTPTYMLHPPKEHLVETYFHPDNMSAVEKMKIELAKVRDEFKMSESDCGSARVQVAQLTTKIKHLSSVLHKKDKHSRKGLQAMVQRRKKLLKYLRRTDWDSYCLALSKLGLRDNPDYKN